MKMPPPLPSIMELDDVGQIGKILDLVSSGVGSQPNDRYVHWEKLRFLKAPQGISNREWWLAIKLARNSVIHKVPFVDKQGIPFSFSDSAWLYQMLYQVDRDASGRIEFPADAVNTSPRNCYWVNSLIEESITSSQLEGAATTRRVAEEMLRTGRKPRNRDEMMIFNNYRAMEFVRELADEDLTASTLLELQSILMDNTVEDSGIAGRFRRPEDEVFVIDQRDNTVLHVPPDATQIEERMERLFRFANTKHDATFIHPVVKAILLHFMIGYDHPFVDGNGRTARAIFYWAMARFGYWMTEYLSISTIIRRAPVQYARAYIYSETDDNDVTYFIDYNLRVILRSIQRLHRYLARKAKELSEVERLLAGEAPISMFNYRQVALIVSMRKYPDRLYTIQSHCRSHNVTYQTARSDLLKLAELGLIQMTKQGRSFRFRLATDFDKRLRDLAKLKEGHENHQTVAV